MTLHESRFAEDRLRPVSPGEPMPPLKHRCFAFGLRTGATLELPAEDLTAKERVTLVATIARALDLPDVDRVIRNRWWWAA